jgi:hypothetical protein
MVTFGVVIPVAHCNQVYIVYIFLAGEVVSSTSRLRAVPGSKNRAASGLRDETQHKLAVKLMRFSQRARNKEVSA